MDTKDLKVNDNSIVIENIQSFVKCVLEKSRVNKYFYRGHASVDYELKPSIGRNEHYSKELEKSIFMEFKKNYYSYTQERPTSDIDLLFLAQHYGLPTRLLDWTYNPMIALYFACESRDDADSCIYAVSPSKFAKLYDSEANPKAPKTIDEVLSIKSSSFVVPAYTDVRYKNQKALFLLSDKPQKSFSFAKKAYIIKKESKKQIICDLATLGYDRTLVYPLLESLCFDIKKLNGYS